MNDSPQTSEKQPKDATSGSGRRKYDAHRVVRALHSSCAAKEIGRDACLLVIFISHAEDAARYRGPARFWNAELMAALGFTSPKQLDRARDPAVAAGWLTYSRATNRSIAEYSAHIPERLHLADSDRANLSPGGMNDPANLSAGGMNQSANLSASLSPGGMNEALNLSPRGKHSIPINTPNPIRNTNTCSSDHERAQNELAQTRPRIVPSESFTDWWGLYPKKVAKGAAAKAFVKAVKLIAADRRIDEQSAIRWLIDRTRLFSDSEKARGQFCPYPATWLNQLRFDDDPTTWNDSQPQAPAAPRPEADSTNGHWEGPADRLLAKVPPKDPADVRLIESIAWLLVAGKLAEATVWEAAEAVTLAATPPEKPIAYLRARIADAVGKDQFAGLLRTVPQLMRKPKSNDRPRVDVKRVDSAQELAEEEARRIRNDRLVMELERAV